MASEAPLDYFEVVPGPRLPISQSRQLTCVTVMKLRQELETTRAIRPGSSAGRDIVPSSDGDEWFRLLQRYAETNDGMLSSSIPRKGLCISNRSIGR